MSFSEEKRKAIQLYMLEKIRMDDTLFLKKTAEVFSISETSVRRYVKMCIDKKLIEVSNKNQCGYRLVTYEKKWSVSNDGTLEEDQIFYAEILPELKEISKNAKDIWAYTFAEIMNNAIEHSGAEKISSAAKAMGPSHKSSRFTHPSAEQNLRLYPFFNGQKIFTRL